MSATNRDKVEKLVYTIMDILDPSGKNSNHYKNKFSKMKDLEFIRYFRDNHLRLEIDSFDVIEIKDMKKALDVINVPMYESVNLPYKYIDENGRPVQTEKCIVGYINIPRLRQLNEKKSANGTDMSKMSQKTGEYTHESKVVAITDRELEANAVFGLDKIREELYTMRSDDVNSTAVSLLEIHNKGSVSLSELPEDGQNLSREYLYACLIGAQLDTNIIS